MHTILDTWQKVIERIYDLIHNVGKNLRELASEGTADTLLGCYIWLVVAERILCLNHLSQTLSVHVLLPHTTSRRTHFCASSNETALLAVYLRNSSFICRPLTTTSHWSDKGILKTSYCFLLEWLCCRTARKLTLEQPSRIIPLASRKYRHAPR